jgi:c(7)-type cytochrome triheme protein
MRPLITLLAAAASMVPLPAGAGEKKPPQELVFPSKSGSVTFYHAAHVRREKGECQVCHPKFVPQSVKVPVKSRSACGPCHHADGRAFDMQGNCARCHAGSAGKAATAAN